jgi:hypothetical protein
MSEFSLTDLTGILRKLTFIQKMILWARLIFPINFY